LALGGCTAALRGHPAIADTKHAHHSGKLGKPDQWPPPPDFFGNFEDGVRSTGVLTIAVQIPYFAEKVRRRHTKQFADARILQRRDAEISFGENWRNCKGDARAEFAVGIEEEPASGVATFAIGVNIDEGDHGVSPRLSLRRCRAR